MWQRWWWWSWLPCVVATVAAIQNICPPLIAVGQTCTPSTGGERELGDAVAEKHDPRLLPRGRMGRSCSPASLVGRRRRLGGDRGHRDLVRRRRSETCLYLLVPYRGDRNLPDLIFQSVVSPINEQTTSLTSLTSRTQRTRNAKNCTESQRTSVSCLAEEEKLGLLHQAGQIAIPD